MRFEWIGRYLGYSLWAAVGLFILWRMIANGITYHYAEQLPQDEDAIEAVLAWSPDFPEALYRRSFIETETTAALTLKKAIFQNPSDGRFFLALAETWLGTGQKEQADKAIAWATALMPGNSALRLAAAQYWAERNNFPKAIQQWNGALIADSRLKTHLYPNILKWLEDARYFNYILDEFKQGVPWWSDFFSYASSNAVATKTVATLFETQRKTSAGVSQNDRRMYIARLQRDGFWKNAYVEWLNTLNRLSLQATAPLYNGSFELPITNMGFDWHIENNKDHLIETRHTYGVRGGKALHLVLRSKQTPFNHFHQPLLLVPGSYRLQGAVRVDNLSGRPGIRWQINCVFGTLKNQNLAGSEYFSGIETWREFVIEFTIPKGCEAQSIRLTSGPKIIGPLRGEVWFDQMTIRKVNAQILAN